MATRRSLNIFFAVILTLVVTAACFSANGPSSNTDAQEITTQVAATVETTTVNDTTTPDRAAEETTEVNDSIAVQVIEEIATIERYRMEVTVKSEVANRATEVRVEGAYIKEPPTEEITMQIAENGETQTFTTLLVDGLRYMRSGEMVVQTIDARMNLQELTLIQPGDATMLDQRFEQLGEEFVNGRETIHYRGGPDAVPTGGTTGDTFDVTGIDSARIDLWIDRAENFIVAMEVGVNGFDEEPDAQMQLRFDYVDINSPDIVIEAPSDAMNLSDGQPDSTDELNAADAPEPRNALGKLLGFDLLLATGSQITLANEQIVQVSTIYTVEEATNLFQAQLPAHGYSLLSLLTPQAGENVLMFQKGVQTATIQITATDGGSDWSVVVSP